MRTFVVPAGLNTTDVRLSHSSARSTAAIGELTLISAFLLPFSSSSSPLLVQQLKPYVSKDVKIDLHDGAWPMADTKPSFDTKRGGIFGPNGFDGAYYLQLAEFMRDTKQPESK